MTMITISLAMIVKNEEQVLGRCLASVAGAVDEIIIVDTGSEDGTKAIAQNFTEKIYDFEWVDDFSAARNFSFSKAAGDYIMWLDADDYLTEEDCQKLLELKKRLDPDVDIVMMKYHIGFDKKGKVIHTNYRERLLKRERGYQWEEPVHESILLQGKLLKVDIAVTHGKKERVLSDRNLKILEQQEQLSPRGLFYYGRELKDHGRYEEALDKYNEFIEGGAGWPEDHISACFEAAYCLEKLEDKASGVFYILQTFLYDAPRAQACCWLGSYFLEMGNYALAIYWYDQALGPNAHKESGIVTEDYFAFIPHMQLCVALSSLGQYELAYTHHLKAQTLKPDDESVLFNANYFAALGFEVGK